jgi:putative ABC transport system permease protein
MNLLENIREGLRAIRANMLRTVLTGLIIAIGIMSLVGILTAIEGIRTSVESNFASLGAHSFDLRGTRQWGRRNGENDKVYPPIEYRQARQYQELYTYPATVSITTIVTGIAEAKYESNKSNPNVRVVGGDDNYLAIKGLNLEKGRNFSNSELENAVNVAIIGAELVETLFPNKEPLNALISVLGEKYKVIGVLEKKGNGIGGGGTDRTLLVPLEVARRLAAGRTITYDITTLVNSATDMPMALGEATGLMRKIRRDQLGRPDSFEITKSDSLTEELDNITHEYHAGIGNGANPGDWGAQGVGRYAHPYSSAIPDRGIGGMPTGWTSRRWTGTGDRQPDFIDYQLRRRFCDSLAVDGVRSGHLYNSRLAFRILSGLESIQARSDRVTALRIGTIS